MYRVLHYSRIAVLAPWVRDSYRDMMYQYQSIGLMSVVLQQSRQGRHHSGSFRLFSGIKRPIGIVARVCLVRWTFELELRVS
jgi:hypothetical protein